MTHRLTRLLSLKARTFPSYRKIQGNCFTEKRIEDRGQQISGNLGGPWGTAEDVSVLYTFLCRQYSLLDGAIQ